MKRVLVLVGTFVLAFALVGLVGRSVSAAPPEKAGDHMVAAAGIIREHDGETYRFAVGAVTVDGVTRGNFRFVAPDEWHYNGAVRDLTVDGETATVRGGGVVRDAGGTHRVRFTVTATAGKPGSLRVEIHGEDFDYVSDAPITRGHVWVE